MKLITIFSLSLLFCLATVNAQNGYNAYNNQGAYNNQFANTQNGNVKMHPLQDPQTGMVAGHLPLPANWKVTPNKWQGPENTAVELPYGWKFFQHAAPGELYRSNPSRRPASSIAANGRSGKQHY
jgi:hypothetical protein